jgi:hypothetical protein
MSIQYSFPPIRSYILNCTYTALFLLLEKIEEDQLDHPFLLPVEWFDLSLLTSVKQTCLIALSLSLSFPPLCATARSFDFANRSVKWLWSQFYWAKKRDIWPDTTPPVFYWISKINFKLKRSEKFVKHLLHRMRNQFVTVVSLYFIFDLCFKMLLFVSFLPGVWYRRSPLSCAGRKPSWSDPKQWNLI